MTRGYAALSVELVFEGVDGVDIKNHAVRLLPMGGFAPNDGRPLPCLQWVLSEATASRIVQYWSVVPEEMVIDYDHQTQKAETNGQPAPAAGWVKALEVRADGIYATIDWTDTARAYIKDRQYRYISPVFSFDKKTGEVLMLHMAGLVNTPGLTGLTELNPALLNKRVFNFKENGESQLDKELLKSLGLAEDADAPQAVAAVAVLQGELSTAKALSVSVTAELATLTAEKASVGAELATLKAADKGVTAVAALQTQVVALQAELNGSKVKSLVDEGMADGRILPAMKDWAESLGRSDVAQLQAFLKNAPKIAALQSQQSAGMTHGSGTTDASGLTADELAVCHSTGVSPKDFAAAKKEFAV